jgi:hypothetical protein
MVGGIDGRQKAKEIYSHIVQDQENVNSQLVLAGLHISKSEIA